METFEADPDLMNRNNNGEHSNSTTTEQPPPAPSPPVIDLNTLNAYIGQTMAQSFNIMQASWEKMLDGKVESAVAKLANSKFQQKQATIMSQSDSNNITATGNPGASSSHNVLDRTGDTPGDTIQNTNLVGSNHQSEVGSRSGEEEEDAISLVPSQTA